MSRGVELVELAWGVEGSSRCRGLVSRCRGQGSVQQRPRLWGRAARKSRFSRREGGVSLAHDRRDADAVHADDDRRSRFSRRRGVVEQESALADDTSAVTLLCPEAELHI